MSTAEIQSLLRIIDQNEHDPNYHGQDETAPEKILLDEAEQIYRKLIDDITGKCVNEIPNDTESISQTKQFSSLEYDLSQEEDPHTSHNVCEVEDPVSEVLSNFATQICESHDQDNDIS